MKSGKLHEQNDKAIDQLFREGQRLLIKKQQDAEKEKVGILRAGNTGLLLPDGTVTGKCHRLTALRYLGIDVETEEDLSKELMFDNGRSNEDLWYEVLKNVWNGPILREEEIPIQWLTQDGTKVTGRPDIVLCRYTSPAGSVTEVGHIEPVKGIELKLASSVWTARDVLAGNPKPMHLMQAAHYMWQLNVPFELWYTSRVDWPIVGWMTKLFPPEGELHSSVIGYKVDSRTGKSEPSKLYPFRVGYELRWNKDGYLEYRQVFEGHYGAWVTSIITIDRIKQYYDFVLETVKSDKLGPLPQNLEADGSKGSYKICDYCPLNAICSKLKETDKFSLLIKHIKGGKV